MIENFAVIVRHNSYKLLDIADLFFQGDTHSNTSVIDRKPF